MEFDFCEKLNKRCLPLMMRMKLVWLYTQFSLWCFPLLSFVDQSPLLTILKSYHIRIQKDSVLFFDYNGTEIDFPLKINSKTTENYPDKILKDNTQAVKKPKITFDSAIQILQDTIKKPLHNEIRNLKEKFTVLETAEIYVPIYEARLTGPKNKAGILRLDAVRKKIL